jgi:hypothetical protein
MDVYLPLGLLYWISLNFLGQTGYNTMSANQPFYCYTRSLSPRSADLRCYS